MGIKYNEDFLNSLKTITKISKKIVIQQSCKDKVIIAQQGELKDINIFVEAPQSAFDYDKDVAFGDYNNFHSVFKASGDNPVLSVTESFDDANIIHINGADAEIDYGLSISSLMNPGNTTLPVVNKDSLVNVAITESDLKNIKLLTSTLIVSGSASGTKLNILKEKNSDIVKLTFKAHEAVGHKFIKTFKTKNVNDVEIKLVFDPLFFTWLPVADYEFTIAVGENIISHIKATNTIVDSEDNFVCNQHFVAGPLRVSYVE